MNTELDERNEKAARLADRLRASIATVADDDVRRWVRRHPAGHELVSEPEREFLLHCVQWVQSGDPDDIQPMARAFDRVVDAWRRAGVAYRRQEARR